MSANAETVREWRGPAECRDRSNRPRKLPWKASEEERAGGCELRRAIRFPLDDLAFVIRHFLPHLNRDKCLPHPQGRRAEPAAATFRREAGTFGEYELGFVHMDVKHLPKLRTADRELRKRHLFVAIDRRSRLVHLAVRDDETEASASGSLATLARTIRPVGHADAAPFRRDVDPGVVLHGCPSMRPGADPFGPRPRRHSEGQPPPPITLWRRPVHGI